MLSRILLFFLSSLFYCSVVFAALVPVPVLFLELAYLSRAQ